jgi:hypothetical protein
VSIYNIDDINESYSTVQFAPAVFCYSENAGANSLSRPRIGVSVSMNAVGDVGLHLTCKSNCKPSVDIIIYLCVLNFEAITRNEKQLKSINNLL